MQQHFEQTRTEALAKANILMEALPWINEAAGKTVVVKYGGAAMEDPSMREQVIQDIVMLKLMGVRVVIVHGGGKAISSLMKRLDLPVEFKDGLRVTTDETMEAVQMALIGKVNQELVTVMNRFGALAVGVTGADCCLLEAEQIDPELGRVGTVSRVNTELIDTLLDTGHVPIVAGVAYGEDGLYNVNADLVASEIATALKAHKLFFLTDVDGLYRDFSDKSSLIPWLTLREMREMIADGSLESGMIPKIRASADAIEAGVGSVVILNGTFPHALLLEIFTDEGVGTLMHGDSYENQEA